MSDWDVLSIIHGKLLGCSNDAVATFWRLVTWARGPGAPPRPGFVTRSQVRAWSGGLNGKRLDAVIMELVDAGKPAFTHGLLDPADGGFEIHDFDQYGRDVEIVAALAPMPVAPPARATRPEVSAARAAAGRAGGLRSAESRLASKQTAQPLKQSPEANPDFASGPAKQTPEANLGSSFGSDLGSDLEIQEIPKENPPPKDLSGLARGDVCFEEDEEFLNLPIEVRAEMVGASPELAALHRPHRWSEVVAIVGAFALATGRGRGCGAYERDSGVRTAVALLAVFELEAILRAVPVAVKTEWWQREPGRPLAHLSVTVVEDALGRDAAAARAAVMRRHQIELSTTPRKATPPPMTASEMLQAAQAAMKVVGNA